MKLKSNGYDAVMVRQINEQSCSEKMSDDEDLPNCLGPSMGTGKDRHNARTRLEQENREFAAVAGKEHEDRNAKRVKWIL